METKECKRCKTEKPKDEFYGRHLTCMDCYKIKNRKAYKSKKAAKTIDINCNTVMHLLVPTIPSVIRTKSRVNFNIEDLDDKTLEKIGREWTKGLIKKAKERRV